VSASSRRVAQSKPSGLSAARDELLGLEPVESLQVERLKPNGALGRRQSQRLYSFKYVIVFANRSTKHRKRGTLVPILIELLLIMCINVIYKNMIANHKKVTGKANLP